MNMRGYTLVEITVGIVVFSIALVLITGVLSPLTSRSIEPIYQVRAAELAQSLLNEITSKSFDENSFPDASNNRCNEDADGDAAFASVGESQCSSLLGPEELSRADFDDVDDYNGLALGAGFGVPIQNSLGETIDDGADPLYAGFSISVQVSYDGNLNGLFDAGLGIVEQAAKRVVVTVVTPSGEDLSFVAYRFNY